MKITTSGKILRDAKILSLDDKQKEANLINLLSE